MCKFEIDYSYVGGEAKTRTAVVFAETLVEAVLKIAEIDSEYEDVESVRFKEIPGWRPGFKAEK